ncbi:MAG TPA: hypothetical protein VIV11_39915 [Kofleriaceae bacterium]
MLRAAILVMAMSGCSFALVSGPPANHRELPSFDCTTSRLGPGLDVAWSILQGLNIATAASQSDAEWDDMYGGDAPLARSTALPLYVALAGLGVAGMYYGFSRTGSCRQAKNELVARQMQPGGMQPQPGVGTWPPPAAPVGPPPPAPVPAPGEVPPAPAPAPPAPPAPPPQ